MRVRALLVIAMAVVFGIGILAQQPPRKAASPAGTAATQVGGTWSKAAADAEPRYTGGKWIEITYGRPVLRGRTAIFGAGADYGKQVSDGVPVARGREHDHAVRDGGSARLRRKDAGCR
jgi:hypothetical protein